MPTHSDPLAEPTVAVPAPPHAEPAAGGAAPYPEAPSPYAAPHTEAPSQYAAPHAEASPQYAASYEQPQQPYPPQAPGSGVPYGAPPAGYGEAPQPRPAKGDRGALVAACLAFLVVVLGAPALVLAWRSAVGPHLAPAGLVGGLLAVTGLSVLAVGLFPLLTARGDTQPEAGPAALLRAPVLLALIGAVLLVGAAIAV
jgi:hypothetical protein